MEKILNIKAKHLDGFEAEYETSYVDDEDDWRAEAEKTYSEILRLTNHADGIDYAMAVTCGILTGMIDSIFVGEWDFKSAKAMSNKEINLKVMKFAKDKGYDGERLEGAVAFLEKKYPLPGDNAWNIKSDFINMAKEKGFSGTKYEEAVKYMNEKFPSGVKWGVDDNFITASSHHLDDYCHHPTFVGLICCILVQFNGNAKYRNKNNEIVKIPITVNDYGNFVGNNPTTKLFSGVINWFFNVAKETVKNRKGHLISDMAGSYSSARKGNAGSGIPGSFLSTLKELSGLKIFKDSDFGVKLQKAFQNGIGAGKNQLDLGAFNSLFDGASSKFDMRTEMAVGNELKRQSIPVIINEVLVRSIYFIRRFIDEIKSKRTLELLDWKNLLPVRNRTIVRMITIATGTFTAVDLADAALRAAVATGVTPAFWGKFVLRVNFVGLGRFVIAVGTDIGMEIKLNSISNSDRLMVQRMFLQNYCTQLKNIDIKRFELEVSGAYELSLSLTGAESDEELNVLLKNGMEKLGIECPWGGGTLDDFMNDPEAVLKF